ncbi:hypothetical protein PIB30_118563 [Stylosanthes scabra]|uniref:Chromatin structure-remodeling complex protein SYD n=1 Tax=Stylosanthes scabra TaxID=79078 RepID=A0ABU6U6Z2_9FABA|nr:hypothetical protein [Stylosanthes scabra]
MHDSSSNNLSKTSVLENSRNKSLGGSTLPVTEVTRDQQLEAKTHSDEAPKADTSAVHSTNETKEGSNKAIEPMAAQAVPNASDSVYPSISGSESIQPCPPESMPVKRHGRKAQNRVEPPRRRGRKSSSASPVVSDSLAKQDPSLNHPVQNSPVESLVGKATTDVAQAQAFQILLPSGGAAHDLKRKEGAANSSQNKQQKVASSRVDSAPVSSDKVTAFGRMQNVNDVARVMKEVFSGTCLPKTKAPDSAAGEPSKTKTTVDSMDTQLNADRAGYDITNTEAECLTPGIAVNIKEKQSEGEFNNQKLEDKERSDMPTIGAVDVSNIQCKEDKADLEHDKQSEETSNLQIIEGKENSDMPTTGAVNASNTQGFADKTGFDMPSTEAACTTSDLAVNRNEIQSEETSTTPNLEGKATSDTPTTVVSTTGAECLVSDLAVNVQNLEDKTSLDVLTTVAASPDLDHEVNKDEKQVVEASIMPAAGVVVASSDQFLEDKPGMDEPTSGAVCLTSDLAVNQHEQELEEASSIQKLDVESSSDVPTTGAVSASNIQCSEEKACSEISASEDGCPTVDLAVNRKEKQPEEESSIQNLEDKISSDIPITGALCLTSIIPTDGNVQQSGPPSDQEITALNEADPNAMEIDTPICDDIKEKQDHIQQCTETYSNQSEVEALDATPLSSEVRTENLPESCKNSSPLASSGENDQPQETPSCPVIPPVSKEVPEDQITVGNNSQNASEPAIEQSALPPSEMESPDVVLTEKHSDALKDAELHDTPLVKGCSKSLSEGRMSMGDSICEPPVSVVDKSSNVDPVPEENVMSPAPICNPNVDSAEVCPMDISTSVSNQVTVVGDNEIVAKSSSQNVNTSSADEVEKIIDPSPDDPVDGSVLQQNSGSEAVANSSVDASLSVLVEEGTVSETTIVPPSSFSIEDNRVSSKTCAISSSETLEKSMEEGVIDRTDTTGEKSCRNATEVPSTVPVLLQESIESEGEIRDQGNSQVGGIPENHETGILAAPRTGSFEAQDESKGLADMGNQAEAIQSHAAETDVAFTSASGDKAECESKGLADVENQAEAIQSHAAGTDVPFTSASEDKAGGESKGLTDLENEAEAIQSHDAEMDVENRAEAIQSHAAETDVPFTSASGDKAEGESKGLDDVENVAEAIQSHDAEMDVENQAEAIQSRAAEMDVPSTSASGDKAGVESKTDMEMDVPCTFATGDKAVGESKGLAGMENQAETIGSHAAETDVPFITASGDKDEGESKGVADTESQAEAIQSNAAEMDVPLTSALGDRAEDESKGLADMENQAEAIQSHSAEMDVPLTSASGDKAEDESKGLADKENQAETIESCAAEMEMEVPCSSASGDKEEGENVTVGTNEKIQVSEDIEAVGIDETDVSNGGPAMAETASASGALLPCSSSAVDEPVVQHDTNETEADVANQDNVAIQQNALKDAEEGSSAAAADIIEESSPQKDVTDSFLSLPPETSVDGVAPPCPSVAEGEHVESLSDKEALVDSAVKLGTKESEASQDNLVLGEDALKEIEETLPSAAEDRVAVSSPEKNNLTACSEAPQESEKCENGQNRSEEEPGQSSVAEEAKKD